MSEAEKPVPAEQQEAFETWRGQVCSCGSHKDKYRPFCVFCWRKLPRDLHPSLYLHFRKPGYFLAYVAALACLKNWKAGGGYQEE
jgi:hypothetical protein